MKKILILNGPNLNLLGTRQPEIYGNRTFETIFEKLQETYSDVQFDYFQHNIEGELIDKLQASEEIYNGIVLNAGGYSHTSVAIRDAISAIKVPVVEIHLSNIAAREKFRHNSLLTAVCVGTIFGFGAYSYNLGILALTNLLSEAN